VVDSQTLTTLSLYPLLPLLPRWPGLEEDEDLAGPTSAPAPSAPGGLKSGSASPAPVSASSKVKETRIWTREELEVMNVRDLGRLRNKGVDVGDLMQVRKKELKKLKEERKAQQSGAGGSGGSGSGVATQLDGDVVADV
jgi:tRNA (guanine-N(7)-)-methyltransferase subunit TRM82